MEDQLIWLTTYTCADDFNLSEVNMCVDNHYASFWHVFMDEANLYDDDPYLSSVISLNIAYVGSVYLLSISRLSLIQPWAVMYDV